MAAKNKKSPNEKIDKALEKLMKRIDSLTETVPLDDAVRVINSAIAWERVKAHITEDDPFDPDDL
jgi:hypothetical protein